MGKKKSIKISKLSIIIPLCIVLIELVILGFDKLTYLYWNKISDISLSAQYAKRVVYIFVSLIVLVTALIIYLTWKRIKKIYKEIENISKDQ